MGTKFVIHPAGGLPPCTDADHIMGTTFVIDPAGGFDPCMDTDHIVGITYYNICDRPCRGLAPLHGR